MQTLETLIDYIVWSFEVDKLKSFGVDSILTRHEAIAFNATLKLSDVLLAADKQIDLLKHLNQVHIRHVPSSSTSYLNQMLATLAF